MILFSVSLRWDAVASGAAVRLAMSCLGSMRHACYNRASHPVLGAKS